MKSKDLISFKNVQKFNHKIKVGACVCVLIELLEKILLFQEPQILFTFKPSFHSKENLPFPKMLAESCNSNGFKNPEFLV